jgi:hypothetical protein
VQIKVTKANPSFAVLQENNSNHLIMMNGDLNAVGTSNTGTFEEGDSKQAFKSFRHSLDDSYMLYRSGGPKLDIFDLSKGVVDESIPTFWITNNLPATPIAAVATPDANKILGLSMLTQSANGQEIRNNLFHYYERIGEKTEVLVLPEKKVLDQTSKQISPSHERQQPRDID